MKIILVTFSITVLAFSMFWISCDDGGEGSSDGDTDTDTDTDVDSDSDSDSDGDCTAPDASECSSDWGVFDSNSCLCWEVPGTTAEYTWDEAMAYCENLSLGGLSDWILASKQNYMDMLGGCDDRVLGGASGYCNECSSVTVCQSIFYNDEALYWTSTQSGDSSVVYVEPRAGWINVGGKHGLDSVRCVRSIK